MNIGERIKKRRIELGLSVDDIAKQIGKNRATIYRYESSEIEDLPTSILEPLSKALHTTPAVLMGWEEKPKGCILLKYDYTGTNSEIELNNEEAAFITHLKNADNDSKLQALADLDIPVLAFPVCEKKYKKLTKEKRTAVQNFLFKNSDSDKELEILQNYMKLNSDGENKLLEYLNDLLSSPKYHN